jgi:hypothetical protein
MLTNMISHTNMINHAYALVLEQGHSILFSRWFLGSTVRNVEYQPLSTILYVLITAVSLCTMIYVLITTAMT